MTPTWYDLLGLDRDASPEQIRAAWKGGIADLGPGERRFRSLNDAAEVLLDPARRAAYDATLEPEEQERQPEPEPSPVASTGSTPGVRAPERVVETETHVDAAPPRRGVPAWVLLVLALLTALTVLSAAYLATQPSDEAIAESTADAQATAESSVVTILSYDYRKMDQDQQAAGALMTAGYRADYDKLFEQIKANAPALKAVVSCEVIASGVVRSGEDRVQVLVFVNRPTTRADLDTPRVYRDQVRMTMVRSGDEWLVDEMQTSPTAA